MDLGLVTGGKQCRRGPIYLASVWASRQDAGGKRHVLDGMRMIPQYPALYHNDADPGRKVDGNPNRQRDNE
jgi:hypothetical protein